MRKQIIWEHIEKETEYVTLEDKDEKYFDKEGYSDENENIISQQQEVTPTPFGLFLKNDPYNPMNRFDFWKGITDFDIGQQELDTIDRIPGVEALYIHGRYEFWVAVGKAFSFSTVRATIQKELCGFYDNQIQQDEVISFIESIEEEKIREEIYELINNLLDKYKEWGMYVFPNGKIKSIFNDNNKDYKSDIEMLFQLNDKSGGLLILSEN
jgi:hypothetical protein